MCFIYVSISTNKQKQNIMEFTNRSQAKKQTGLSYLGSINSSAKIVKNKKLNVYTYIIYLAPAATSGYNVCAHSTPECRLGCLATSGRAKMDLLSKKNIIQNARFKKTRLFYEHNEFFMNWVVAEMKSYQAKAKREGYYFSARINGTSDIELENYLIEGKNIFEIFPEVQFYDYTKNPARMLKPIAPNYHLTFSYSGRNESAAVKTLESKQNVAVIFNVKDVNDFPKTWNGFKVINGDETDYRPNDGKGVVVALKWKDIANKEVNNEIKNSCFVTQVVNVPTGNVQLA